MRIEPSPSIHMKNLIHLFYGCAHEDEPHRKTLDKHLAVMRRDGLIATWGHHEIKPGATTDLELGQQLENASLIVLMVSAHFLASSFCQGEPLARTLQRHREEAVTVLPVLLRKCDWRETAFGHLEPLPKGGTPITSSRNRDEAWHIVVQGIRDAARSIATHANGGSVRRGTQSRRTKIVLRLETELDSISSEQLARLTDLLRTFSGDGRLVIKKVSKGSLKLHLDTSKKAAEILDRLASAGALARGIDTLVALPVEHGENDDYYEQPMRGGIDPRAPLHEQFRRQKYILNRAKGRANRLRNVDIAELTHLSVDAINQLFSLNAKRPRPETAALVGGLLHFDIAHIALVYLRDRLAEAGPSFAGQVAELENLLGFQDPRRPRRSLHRLAFRMLRQQAAVPLEALAQVIAAETSTEAPGRRRWRQVLLRLVRFEGGFQDFPAQEVRTWTNSLARLTNSRLDLDATAMQLVDVHDLKSTISWTTWRDTYGLSAKVPPGSMLMLGYTPTIFESVSVEFYHCRRPLSSSQPVVVSGEHSGWEIAIVLEGAVELVMRRREPSNPSKLMSIGPPRRYERHELISFSSALVHEITFVDSEVLLASITVRSNLYLGRRL